MTKSDSWMDRSFLGMRPIIVPDTPYLVTLTDGKELNGISNEVTDRDFLLNGREVLFKEIHDFKILSESQEDFVKRKSKCISE